MVGSNSQLQETSEELRIFSLKELCHVCRLDEFIVLELIEYDVIQPDSDNDSFSYRQFRQLEKALRLKQGLELNTQGVAVVIELLERLRDQERELELLRYQLSHSVELS